MKKKLANQLLRIGLFASLSALPITLVGCRTAARTGEVEVYKITPAAPARGAGAESGAYLLKGRGFAVGENSFRLSDSFGGYAAVSKSGLKTAADALEQDAYKAYLKRKHLPEDPDTKALLELHEKIRALRFSLPAPDKDEAVINTILAEMKEISMETDAIAEVYTSMRRYYERSPTQSLLKFPYTFRVGGRSLNRSIDYVRRDVVKGKVLPKASRPTEWLQEAATEQLVLAQQLEKFSQQIKVNEQSGSELSASMSESSKLLDQSAANLMKAAVNTPTHRLPETPTKEFKDKAERISKSAKDLADLSKSSLEAYTAVQQDPKSAPALKQWNALSTQMKEAAVNLLKETEQLGDVLYGPSVVKAYEDKGPIPLNRANNDQFIQLLSGPGTAFGDLETRMSNHIRELQKPKDYELHMIEQATNLVARYRELVEYGLNFSALSLDQNQRPVKEVYRIGQSGLEPLSVRGAFDRTSIAAEAIRINYAGLESACRDILKTNMAAHQDQRLELEAFARDLADKTGGPLFRSLVPAPEGKPPTLVTFELRTLYLRALGKNQPRNKMGTNTTASSLLVTCAVKNSDNAQDAVYPVIYEEDYAPTHFVNRKDRIIYGPAPYNGLAFDVRFTVMELAKVSSDQLIAAVGSATKVISIANPELAAISPVVTAFFKSVVDNIEWDKKEFDISFSLPQVPAKNKSNTRFLVSETGHYILIKTENGGRGLGEEEAKRQLFRTLVYNEDDGCLYKRRDLANPSDNFKPENLFLDQSYAVIVVTDQDSNDSDKLGEKLRQQVGQSLGQARSKKLIPDVEETRKLISRYMITTGRTNKLAAIDGAAFASTAKNLKDTLWNDIADTEKAFIVDTLLSRTDDTTALLLGTDPDKWKNASIRIDEKGVIRLTDRKEENEGVIIPEQASQILFPFGTTAQTTGANLFLEDASGTRAKEIKGIGSIDDAGKLQLGVDVAGNLNSDYVRAVAFEPLSKSTVASRKYDFQGLPFVISSAKTKGADVKLTELSAPADQELDLDLIITGPAAYQSEGFTAYLGTNVLGSVKATNILTLKIPKTTSTNSSVVAVIPAVFNKLFAVGKTNKVPVQTVEVRRNK